jgi:thiol-disulfide isomerase/thioredoxin
MNYFIKRVLIGFFVVIAVWFGVKIIFNSPEKAIVTDADIHFFYSQTCPHCHEEQKFLDDLQTRYPDLLIARHDVSKRETNTLLREFGEKYDVKNYLSVVPLTFVYDSFILGFNTPETTGAAIEKIVKEKFIAPTQENAICEDTNESCTVPITENIVDDKNYTTIDQLSNLSLFGFNAKDLSLPVLAIVLGFFDGFNVCSLGALLLILSLVFVFKSRKKTFIFGGVFIAVTGLTYAALIFLWFGLFSFFSSFVSLFQALIGAMGVIGGIYFIRQYIRFLKYGPTCEMTESEWIKKATKKLQSAFIENKNIWIIVLAVILFSFAVTVIEFPCSAVIPVAFAAILTEAGVGFLAKAGYLSIFMILYLLDEIIVFLIGVSAMKIWVGGQKMTKHLPLVQGVMFIGLGIFYIVRLIS